MTPTRRSFLGAAAAATSSMALPAVASPFGRERRRARGDKARLMVIGVAGRGGANLNGVKDQDIKGVVVALGGKTREVGETLLLSLSLILILTPG